MKIRGFFYFGVGSPQMRLSAHMIRLFADSESHLNE